MLPLPWLIFRHHLDNLDHVLVNAIGAQPYDRRFR